MSGERTPDRPLVLVAEYYASGGTRTYIKQLLEFYARRQRPVILIACHPKPDTEIASLLDRYGFEFRSYAEVLGMARTESADSPGPNVWSLRQQARERAAFADLVHRTHAQGVVVSAGTPGQFAGASSASSQGLYILHTYPHGRRQRILGRLVMAHLFRGTSRFVAVSSFQKREMARYWRLGSRLDDIDVVPNTAGPVLPSRGHSGDPSRRVLTASWVEPYKAPLTWLAVAAETKRRVGLGDVRFTWLGEGALLAELRDAVAAQGLTSTVSFPGHVVDVAPEYAAAGVYLQMSTTENMSLSVIEALRFGVPPVVTSAGGLIEIVESGVSGFVVAPGDVSAAADAIQQLLQDPELWSSMSEQAQRRYIERFSPAQWEASMDAVHGQLFGPPEARDGT